jgi:CRP-like cAMP-binding protein
MNGISASNQLIETLEPEDRHALLAAAVPTEFPQGYVFHEPGETIEHVHFIDNGICSSVAVLEDGRTVETLMVGREGLTGVVAALVSSAAFTRGVAQIAGVSRRIDAARLRALTAERPGLRAAITRFMVRLQGELEQSAACNALHRAEQRFAKWLLRCHDRVDGDTLHLTQEYLASMLGSQRTTVNEAAQALQRAGAIAYARARITVTDRAALERAACECYRAVDTVAEAPAGGREYA